MSSSSTVSRERRRSASISRVELYVQIDAEPVEHVVRPSRGDRCERQIRPRWKRRGEQPAQERVVSAEFIRVHLNRPYKDASGATLTVYTTARLRGVPKAQA
jgi:hypothetical protein